MEAIGGKQFLLNYLLQAVINTFPTREKFPMHMRYWKRGEVGEELLKELGMRKEILDIYLSETDR